MQRETNTQMYTLKQNLQSSTSLWATYFTFTTKLKDNFYFILLSLFGYLVSYYQDMKGNGSKTRNKNITLQYFFQLGTSLFISLTIRWWFPPATAFAQGHCA